MPVDEMVSLDFGVWCLMKLIVLVRLCLLVAGPRAILQRPLPLSGGAVNESWNQLAAE